MDHTVAGRLVESSGGAAVGLEGCVFVPGLDCFLEVLDLGLERGALALVADPRRFVLTVPLDLTLYVRHTESTFGLACWGSQDSRAA
ncbi:MAG: hypothetical protein QOD46_997 [Actinomycetota bacterium]|nr:hypothetical protein [Actinomycetota bacterium]